MISPFGAVPLSLSLASYRPNIPSISMSYDAGRSARKICLLFIFLPRQNSETLAYPLAVFFHWSKRHSARTPRELEKLSTPRYIVSLSNGGSGLEPLLSVCLSFCLSVCLWRTVFCHKALKASVLRCYLRYLYIIPNSQASVLL